MKKIFKRIIVLVPLILLMLVSFVVISSYLEHRDLIAEEKEKFPAPGEMIEINEGKIHVYAEGQGDDTLVFMSGLGTSSPYYDFKPLFEKLSQDHQIIIIERPGYGWSDITSTARDLPTVLAETRTVLETAGFAGPYNLIPHSLAGMEAIYWAQNYPAEVERIFGLDPLIPEYYEQDEYRDNPLSRVVTFLARTGLMRQQENVCQDNFPAIQKGKLEPEEIEMACTLFMRRIMTKNMWEEYRSLDENSQLILERPRASVPFYSFISGEAEEKWQDTLKANSEQSFILDAGHYVHLDQTEYIAEKISELME